MTSLPAKPNVESYEAADNGKAVNVTEYGQPAEIDGYCNLSQRPNAEISKGECRKRPNFNAPSAVPKYFAQGARPKLKQASSSKGDNEYICSEYISLLIDLNLNHKSSLIGTKMP